MPKNCIGGSGAITGSQRLCPGRRFSRPCYAAYFSDRPSCLFAWAKVCAQQFGSQSNLHLRPLASRRGSPGAVGTPWSLLAQEFSMLFRGAPFRCPLPLFLMPERLLDNWCLGVWPLRLPPLGLEPGHYFCVWPPSLVPRCLVECALPADAITPIDLGVLGCRSWTLGKSILHSGSWLCGHAF